MTSGVDVRVWFRLGQRLRPRTYMRRQLRRKGNEAGERYGPNEGAAVAAFVFDVAAPSGD